MLQLILSSTSQFSPASTSLVVTPCIESCNQASVVITQCLMSRHTAWAGITPDCSSLSPVSVQNAPYGIITRKTVAVSILQEDVGNGSLYYMQSTIIMSLQQTACKMRHTKPTLNPFTVSELYSKDKLIL